MTKGDRMEAPAGHEESISAQIDAQGYAIIEGALSPKDLDRLRVRLGEQMEGEAARNIVFSDIGDNRRIFNLINKGRIFEELALHPVGLAAARKVLGTDYLLSSMTANIVQSPGIAQYVHRDQTPEFRCPITVQILWALDDFTAGNGATRVIAHSDRWGPDIHAFTQEQLVALARPAEAPAGSAIIFGGMTVHCAGANDTSRPRRGVLSYYSRPFIRQSENYALSLSPEVYERADEELLGLLGFRSHASFGWVDGPTPGDPGAALLRDTQSVRRPDSFSGPLAADGTALPPGT